MALAPEILMKDMWEDDAHERKFRFVDKVT
jgi:hypothetical protein